ncbi:MAG: DUF6096 family protein, partial [Romboutsia timonensis]
KRRMKKMMYVDFAAGNKNYKLRLNTRNLVMLEKQLGENPLSIFGNGETLPTITQMVNVLYCSLLQYNHGINLNDAYDIFDDYLADGNSMTDFIPVILEIYKVSGLIGAESVEEAEGEAEGKN